MFLLKALFDIIPVKADILDLVDNKLTISLLEEEVLLLVPVLTITCSEYSITYCVCVCVSIVRRLDRRDARPVLILLRAHLARRRGCLWTLCTENLHIKPNYIGVIAKTTPPPPSTAVA